MTRHVVIGTAGHVDHGKTALVRLLTGTDTDRWEEEKRRGITIDLGFARLDLTDGLTASIVDVPGHEDFVRNMVAGATGIDVALLVVAADEGVMPQTVEHLAILEFLGVRTGVVAITKVDVVEDDWLELVESDLAERLEASSVVWQPPVRTSASMSLGREALVAALATSAAQAIHRSSDDAFRMPVDRVFSVAGAGTVVTGTTWSGSVAVGDSVLVLPGGRSSRVRSVEVHGQPTENAHPGRRTALALPGVTREDVERGSVVVAGSGWHETVALDVWLTLLPQARRLTQRSRVRLHLGTAEVLARLTPAAEAIEPGATAAARLRLEMPLVARWGDRGVIRSYSPVQTIGGCVIVDPMPAARPRRPHGLERKADVDPLERLTAFVQESGERGIPIGELSVRLGIPPGDVDQLITEAVRTRGQRIVDGTLIAGDVLERAERDVLGLVDRHHRDRPLDPGLPLESVRGAFRETALADAAVQALHAEGHVEVDGAIMRRTGFASTLSADDERLVARLRTVLRTADVQGLTEQELQNHIPGGRARELAEYEVRRGQIARIGRDRYYDAESLEQLRGTIVGVIRDRQRATPAELRDATGLTRKYLIPVLEWMDATGATVREGDSRRLGPAAQAQQRNS
jgi:selenocysteine-specific elongation factor